ncbi:MAG: CHAD domain-containing protein [Thermoplasmata archaeon]|nr:CHAD domain-containing protein [Thermoplasmata archaeon]
MAMEAPIDRLRDRLLARHAALGEVVQNLSAGTPTAQVLHEGHRELRRLRLDAQLWVPLAPPGRSAGYEHVERSLKELTRAIGTVRNFDVGQELLDRLPRRDRETLEDGDILALKRALLRASRVGRRSLASATTDESSTPILDGLDRPLRAALPRIASVRLRRQIDDATSVRLAKLERALARAYRRPTVQRLHQLRLALRAVRSLDQTRTVVLGERALPVTATLRALQVELGRLHDWGDLRENAQEFLRGPRRDRVGGVLSDRVRASRRRLIRALKRKTVRHDFEALLRAAPA